MRGLHRALPRSPPPKGPAPPLLLAYAAPARTHRSVKDLLPADLLGRIELEYTRQERAGRASEGLGLVTWNVTARAVPDEYDDLDEEDAPNLVVGRLRLATVDLWTEEDPLDLFDMISTDFYRIGKAILDTDGELRDELDPSGLTSRVIVLDTAILEPDWRGRELGPLIAGLALRRLSGGCGLAVTYPGSLIDLGYSADEASERLAKVWGKLGFILHADGVHTLDLTTDTLDRAVQRLAARAEGGPR